MTNADIVTAFLYACQSENDMYTFVLASQSTRAYFHLQEPSVDQRPAGLHAMHSQDSPAMVKAEGSAIGQEQWELKGGNF